jgi:membrane protease YdiL (CAAX protease family)
VALGLFEFHSAWIALVGFHLAILLSLWIVRPEVPVGVLRISRNLKWVVASVLLGASSGVTLFYLWDGFGFASDLPDQVQALGLSSSNWIPFIAYFALVNPLLEEYFWRGYLGTFTPAGCPSPRDRIDSTSQYLTFRRKIGSGGLLSDGHRIHLVAPMAGGLR